MGIGYGVFGEAAGLQAVGRVAAEAAKPISRQDAKYAKKIK
jgi:hypothetical protein